MTINNYSMRLTLMEDLAANVDRLLAESGLYFGRPAELIRAIVEHANIVSGVAYCGASAAVMAGWLECSPRTVERALSKLRSAELEWMAIESGQRGHSITIRPVSAPDTAPTDHRQITDTAPPSGRQITDRKVTPSCTGVTIPPQETTSLSEARSTARASEPACEESLSQSLKSAIRSAGWHEPITDFNLNFIATQLGAALETDEQRMAFVTEKLAEMSTRDQRPSLRLVEMALRNDCHGWTTPADRPQRIVNTQARQPNHGGTGDTKYVRDPETARMFEEMGI